MVMPCPRARLTAANNLYPRNVSTLNAFVIQSLLPLRHFPFRHFVIAINDILLYNWPFPLSLRWCRTATLTSPIAPYFALTLAHSLLSNPAQVSQPSVEAIDEIIYDSSPNDSKEVLGQNVTSPATLEVPSDKDTDSLLPQLWSRARFDALQRQLPNMLPHCSLSGDTPLPEGLEGEIAVVVCYVKGTESTVLLSTHLAEWELTFTDALRFGMKNLQKITKGEAAKKPADRWELHPSGYATNQRPKP